MARIAGTFSGKGFNIETIAVNTMEDPKFSKIILTTWGNKETIMKIEKQLNRMVDVLKVDDLTGRDAVRREMVLLRVKLAPDNEEALKKTVETYRGKVVSEEKDYRIIEITGEKEEIERALTEFKSLGMDDFSRTGTVALARYNNKSEDKGGA